MLGIGVCAALATGCHLNDPNHNGKMRYDMASKHARQFLRDSGSILDSSDDYELKIFYRQHYDAETRVVHNLTLYDFVKVSEGPGPKGFVIAYDKHDRQTHLRGDLRTDKNLSGWEEFRKLHDGSSE